MKRDARWMLLPALARALAREVQSLADDRGLVYLGGEAAGVVVARLLAAHPSERSTVRRLIDTLIAAGLFNLQTDALAVGTEDETEGGERSAGARRQARWRERLKASRRDVTRDVSVETRRDVTEDVSPVSHGSLSGSGSEVLPSGSAQDPLKAPSASDARDSSVDAKPTKGSKADRATRGTRCPTSVDDGAAAFLVAHAIPDGPEARKFLDWHASHGTRSLSWPASWRTWSARAGVGFGRPQQSTLQQVPASGRTWKLGEEV